MRLVGPGSGGIEQRHHGLHALIDPATGPAGPVGLGCQSSSIAGAMTRGLDRRGVGVASVVTLGTKADVSGNDLLQAWSDDPTVRVAVLQLESLGNPFRFARIARTVGRDLPVVLLRTAGLHESLPADDAALLRQLGIIDVPSIDEAVDVAVLLATEPPPAGRRVGVVARGRGPGLVARDQLQDLGLQVTQVRAVPPGRPLVEDIRAMRDASGIDALCLVPGEDDEVPRSAGPAGLPVVSCGAGRSPGRAARALARSTVHAEWARQAGQLVGPPRPDRRTVRTILSESPSRADGGWIGLDSATAALHAYGIDATRPHIVRRLEDAGEAASQVGYPVVLDHAIAHGTEALREITTPAALVEEWDRLLRRHGPAALPIAVLAAGPRPELSVHVTAHPQLGPVMSLLPSDRRSGPVRRLLPLVQHDLELLLDEVVGAAGFGAERAVLSELVVRVAGLVADNPELVEVHLDAIDTSSAPALVTGAHLAIAPAPGAGDDQVRHLRRDAP
jgi:acyl-CoA synthetase (NDP forming)